VLVGLALGGTRDVAPTLRFAHINSSYGRDWGPARVSVKASGYGLPDDSRRQLGQRFIPEVDLQCW